MHDGTYLLKTDNLLYFKDNLIKESNSSTIDNMLEILNKGKPNKSFIELNKNLSLFVNKIIDKLNKT